MLKKNWDQEILNIIKERVASNPVSLNEVLVVYHGLLSCNNHVIHNT